VVTLDMQTSIWVVVNAAAIALAKFNLVKMAIGESVGI